MMIKRFILLALGLCGSLSLMAQGDYDTYFTGKSGVARTRTWSTRSITAAIS